MKFKLCRGSLASVRLMRLICVSVVSFSCIISFFTSCATAQEKGNFSEAIGFLAKEQSLAENYAVILKEFGKENIKNYAEGIRLYAEAKAEYDGLIEQLIFNLKEDQALETSPAFQSKMENAADKRVAFTSFVNDKIIRDDPERKNPLAIAAIGLAPELIDALTKAGKTIWQEYRNVKKEKKQEILDQLDTLKWKAFHEIAGGG